jgi:hypothetical protein
MLPCINLVISNNGRRTRGENLNPLHGEALVSKAVVRIEGFGEQPTHDVNAEVGHHHNGVGGAGNVGAIVDLEALTALLQNKRCKKLEAAAIVALKAPP